MPFKRFKPLYLGTRYKELKRWKAKVQGKENWYRDNESHEARDDEKTRKGSGEKMKKVSRRPARRIPRKIKTTTVMFIPSTRGGVLLKLMQENEERLAPITQFRIRYLEAGGRKLGEFFSTDLGRGLHCGRQECHCCNTGGENRPNCKSQSILYESVCELCKDEDTTSTEESSNHEGGMKSGKECGKVDSRRGVYYGETSRSLHERSQEHLKDAERFDPASHMIKHWMVDHPAQKELPLFKFSVIRKFKDCLSRQVAEALRIMSTKDRILNSKNEYLDNCIPRIRVDESKLDRIKREREEDQREQDEQRRLEEFKLEKKSKKRQKSPTKIGKDSRGFGSRPIKKKMRRDMNLTEDFISGVDLAEWLEKNERLCQRVGDLTERMKLEKVRVLEKIKEFRQEEILFDLSNWLNRVEGTLLSNQVVTQAPDVVSKAVNNKI